MSARKNLPTTSSNNCSRGVLLTSYGFENGALTFGPLREHELQAMHSRFNLDDRYFDALIALDFVQPLSSATLNNLAWSYATYDDETKRLKDSEQGCSAPCRR